MPDRLTELLASYNAPYPDNNFDRDDACELVGMLLTDIEQLTADRNTLRNTLVAKEIVLNLPEVAAALQSLAAIRAAAKDNANA